MVILMARKENAKRNTTPAKRLYRSSSERILGGVCGGIADYFNMDPTIVRLLWILFCLIPPFNCSFILLYFIMWVIVPRR